MQVAIELERTERPAMTLDCGISAVAIRCREARRKSFRVVEWLVADPCSMRVVPARARICRHAVQHDEVKIRRLDAPLNELHRIARADPRRELPGVLRLGTKRPDSQARDAHAVFVGVHAPERLALNASSLVLSHRAVHPSSSAAQGGVIIATGSGAMLISCAVYENGRKVAEVPKQDIHLHLGKPGRFVWVALREPTPEELEEMRLEFGLHELAVEDACHGHQRPKVEEYGDCLFVVMHTVELDNGGLLEGELDVFVGRDYVLSVRKRTREGFRNVRERAEREPHLLKEGPGYVLYALMDAVVDRYFPVLDALENELERIEARIFEGAPARANVVALYDLKRELMVLRHAAGPLHDATGKLYGGRVPAVTANTQEYFRDIYDHLLRITQSIESLRDMLSTAITVNLSLITVNESETMKRLAAYAALVAVPTMIAGIYGMNFDVMPELRWQFGYPVTLGVMAVFDGYLFYRFRQAGWL
jgi:magnesium transporter